MKVSVRLAGEWYVIPCGEGEKTIEWLRKETVERAENYSNSKIQELLTHQPRLKRNGAILTLKDHIKDVLEDNDFVVLGLDCTPPESSNSEDKLNNNVQEISVISDKGSFLQGNSKEKTIQYLDMDGNSLSTATLFELGKGVLKIRLTEESRALIKKSREFLDKIVQSGKPAYGVNTGVGKLANVAIARDKLQLMQENIIKSHAAGVGPPLCPERTRRLMALRINVLAKGYSGISLENLDKYIEAFNLSCLPWIPEQGTVGASGDLAPLAHLALGMIGEGKMWSPESGWDEAKTVLEGHGLQPMKLRAKEGIALINGTQFIAGLGAEAVERAALIAQQADIVAALTVEVLKGTTNAFDSSIHKLRPHKGQVEVAQRLRAVLNSDYHPSEVADSHRFCGKVQDAYTMRCCPQVHGIVHDTITFVRDVLNTEINSATDNPMVFPDREEVISGGNFHGEYPAKVLDYLAIAIHEMASISERRIERLVNPAYSGLPPFLARDPGINSGFMLAHCTAAALVSENKGLCHPSSVDSLSTSGGTEDHVSMGGWSARKALKVVENVEKVVAIELLAVCQGLEFLRPLKTTAPLEAVHSLVRKHVRAFDKDRFLAPDIDLVTELLVKGQVWDVVTPHINGYMSALTINDIEPSPPSPTASSLRHSMKNFNF